MPRKPAARRAAFAIGGTRVLAGTRKELEFPVARQPGDTTPQTLPCVVIHGTAPGPKVFVCGAIHGDEINGTAIVRRLVDELEPETLTGTVVLVPVVNLFGFVLDSRYLPDRRDLNRLFPGSDRGSLGSRLAHLFMKEVVGRCDYGLDLHSGSNHRTNAPQIRGNLDDPRQYELAEAFGAGLAVHAKLRPGSLREAADRAGVPTLTYEGGEAHRFDLYAIEAGLRGVRRVLEHVNGRPVETVPLRVVRKSRWLRARRSGMFWPLVEPGAVVRKGQILGRLTDLVGRINIPVKAPDPGVVLGLTLHPPVHQGDALVNVGFTDP